jgi:hypothetical protein
MFGAPIALFAIANWVHIPFEEANVALKIVDARSERKNVVAFRIVYVFEDFREPRKVGP